MATLFQETGRRVDRPSPPRSKRSGGQKEMKKTVGKKSTSMGKKDHGCNKASSLDDRELKKGEKGEPEPEKGEGP